MDQGDVAIELLGVARILLSSDYPDFAGDRVEKAIDVLRAGVQQQQIYNVDFKKVTSYLSDGFEKADEKVKESLGRLFPNVAYSVFSTFAALNGIKKRIREAKDFIRNPVFGKSMMNHIDSPHAPSDTKPEDFVPPMKKYVGFLESWLPILELRKEAKKYIVKGRKIDPAAPVKENYIPPPSSTTSLSTVKKMVDNLIESRKGKLISAISDSILKAAKDFVERQSGVIPGFDKKVSRDMANTIFRMMVNKDGKDAHSNDFKNNNIELSRNASKIADKEANARADYICNTFVLKNMAKLTSIIGEKTRGPVELVSSKVESGDFRYTTFEGWMLLEFSDGTSFRVKNKVVYKWNRGGQFFQFPTTFHDVKFPDGKMMKMVPEKAMNTDWAKA